MFSGAISMATGSYLSSGAQKDIFDKELADAEKLAASEPYIAAEGLLKALGEEGLSKEQSYRMVKVLLAERNVFMRTFQEKVFGLGSAEINQPIKAALVMGCPLSSVRSSRLCRSLRWAGLRRFTCRFS